MKKLFAGVGLLLALCANAQSKDEVEIRKILDDQTAAWNHGDLQNFMKGYWKNDSLMFISKNGVTYGWTNTLDRYKKSYPDTAAMGKLSFTIIAVQALSETYYHVIGKWELARSIGNLSGHYTLVFKKINGIWQIVADHSS